MKVSSSIKAMPKVELHQHLDGSIPPAVTWRIMKSYGLNPVESLTEMKKLLVLQPEEEGSLLRYLDKFHYPMWVTQFYENLVEVTAAVAIVAITMIASVINNALKNRRHTADSDFEARHDKQINELKARIETLEQIVTDDRDHLKRQFEELER